MKTTLAVYLIFYKLIFAEVPMILIMMAQVLFFDVFPEKDPHLKGTLMFPFSSMQNCMTVLGAVSS